MLGCVFTISSVLLLTYVYKNGVAFSFHASTQTNTMITTSEVPQPFSIYKDGYLVDSFPQYKDAVSFAKSIDGGEVHYQDAGIVWNDIDEMPSNILLDIPVINQLPELPRGCEVTSLAMLLHFSGEDVNKIDLAKQVKKDETPYEVVDGVIYFGNPYTGFVGDMYNIKKPGYGVYHGPIRELAEVYKPDRVVDMTGADFQDILFPLLQGDPVWVITNTRYKKLPDSSFQTWQTPTGPLNITYHEHSVVLTGYDKDYIYFNDPLDGVKNKKSSIQHFEQAWIQMGQQAITIVE
ncbi:C39 family peptidase [Bacillus alkalicellulosilyticus]|uniref:C39 family peptidase n=1 Tax=Alkalihalobacterium alkalicellulosilyticum TaxID=1912214 RepID=UPI001FE60703|nr:C39 family peptidase [Bacillus alkalicellulosilyticus]